MFSRKKNNPPPKPPVAPAEQPKMSPRKAGTGIPSIVSADLKILGNIVSDGVVDLDGIVEGNVRCHTITLRKNGHIKGDVVADTVHVYGRIQGLIKARNVQFFKGARAEGVIMHESITIEDGAFVDGRFKRMETVDLDNNEDTTRPDVATLPAEEPKKLFGPGKELDDSEFKTPSFMTSDDNDSDEADSADDSKINKGLKKGRKAPKQESVMDNLRLISDAN